MSQVVAVLILVHLLDEAALQTVLSELEQKATAIAEFEGPLENSR